MEKFVRHFFNIQHTSSVVNTFEEPENFINIDCLDNPVTVEKILKILSLLKRNKC